MTGLLDPAPRRSAAAFWLALMVATVSLGCAVAAWAAASPARAGAAAQLLDRGDLAEYHLLRLDEIVRFRFLDLALAYLAVAVLFAALAVAVRLGPRWSVALTGTLSAAGALIIAWIGLGRLLQGLSPVGDWSRGETARLLAESAPMWFGPAQQLPLLATLAGLPLILVLLVNGRFRARAQDRADDHGLGW